MRDHGDDDGRIIRRYLYKKNFKMLYNSILSLTLQILCKCFSWTRLYRNHSIAHTQNGICAKFVSVHIIIMIIQISNLFYRNTHTFTVNQNKSMSISI